MIIGITGKAGCGKSTLADALKRRGLGIIELDKVGHEVLEEIQDKLKELFGAQIISNDHVDRAVLAGIVFNNPEKLRQLNAVVHPLIKKKVIDILSKAQKHLVIDGALLHQIGLDDYCDLVIFVDCPEELALKRLIKRGVDEIKAREILKAQKFLTKYIKNSNYLVINDEEPTKLIESVLKILLAHGVVL